MTDLSPIEAYQRYLEMARHHENAGRIDAAFACLEAAHILGQQRTTLHVGAHVAMWLLACRQLDLKEAIGQVTRIVAAALVTWIWVPEGNTGRSGVSAFRQMSLPEDLRELMVGDVGPRPTHQAQPPVSNPGYSVIPPSMNSVVPTK